MNPTTSVQVPHPILLELLLYLGNGRKRQDPGDAVAEAIVYWLKKMHDRGAGTDAGTSAIGEATEDTGPGYQWKSLFLPEGTRVRCLHRDGAAYAMVEGDRIIHEGRAVTPNQLANMFGSGVRNAWTQLYLRLPGDKYFKQAALHRAALKARRKVEEAAVPAVAAPIAAFAVAAAETPARPRDTTRPPGWDLPERRKFRYRLEDVDF